MRETIVGAMKLLWVFACLGGLVYMGFLQAQRGDWVMAGISWTLGAVLLLWSSHDWRQRFP